MRRLAALAALLALLAGHGTALAAGLWRRPASPAHAHAHHPGCPWRATGRPCPHAAAGGGPALVACGDAARDAGPRVTLRAVVPAAPVGRLAPLPASPSRTTLATVRDRPPEPPDPDPPRRLPIG